VIWLFPFFLLIGCTFAGEPSFIIQPNPAKLLSPALTEVSGLVTSRVDDQFFWLINDSGCAPDLHLATKEGTPRGALHVNATNQDWEDLAAFSLNGKPYLLIADTGDNEAVRSQLTLYIVREPKLPSKGEFLSGNLPIAWRIDFTFEDGARDCEAVAVDAAAEKIYLISKRTRPPVLYELPLRPSKHPIARRITSVSTKTPGIPLPYSLSDQPTGMDISKDNQSAAVVTYRGVLLFRKSPDESWAKAFTKKPEFLGAHALAQAESVTFSKNSKNIFTVSENVGSPIIHYAASK